MSKNALMTTKFVSGWGRMSAYKNRIYLLIIQMLQTMEIYITCFGCVRRYRNSGDYVGSRDKIHQKKERTGDCRHFVAGEHERFRMEK